LILLGGEIDSLPLIRHRLRRCHLPPPGGKAYRCDASKISSLLFTSGRHGEAVTDEGEKASRSPPPSDFKSFGYQNRPPAAREACLSFLMFGQIDQYLLHPAIQYFTDIIQRSCCDGTALFQGVQGSSAEIIVPQELVCGKLFPLHCLP